MKRRTFIKGIATAAVSLLMPRRSRAHTPEKAIPDPGRTREEIEFAKRYVLFPDAVDSHLYDAFRYRMIQDREFFSGLQWSRDQQRELNLRRSRMIDKMATHKINRIKK